MLIVNDGSFDPEDAVLDRARARPAVTGRDPGQRRRGGCPQPRRAGRPRRVRGDARRRQPVRAALRRARPGCLPNRTGARLRDLLAADDRRRRGWNAARTRLRSAWKCCGRRRFAKLGRRYARDVSAPRLHRARLRLRTGRLDALRLGALPLAAAGGPLRLGHPGAVGPLPDPAGIAPARPRRRPADARLERIAHPQPRPEDEMDSGARRGNRRREEGGRRRRGSPGRGAAARQRRASRPRSARSAWRGPRVRARAR